MTAKQYGLKVPTISPGSYVAYRIPKSNTKVVGEAAFKRIYLSHSSAVCRMMDHTLARPAEFTFSKLYSGTWSQKNTLTAGAVVIVSEHVVVSDNTNHDVAWRITFTGVVNKVLVVDRTRRILGGSYDEAVAAYDAQLVTVIKQQGFITPLSDISVLL